MTVAVVARRSLVGAVIMLALAGCARPDPADTIPLSHLSSGGSGASSAQSAISDKARMALERGNDEYRGGRYAEALAAYTDAAREAPESASPYFGLLMVAQRIDDRALADSASRMIRKLAADLAPELTDSVMRVIHGPSASPTGGH